MNSRFVVAVHALALLAHRGAAVTSGDIARSASTNPVVIRRLLGQLREAGLVATGAGRHGGFRLARAAESISLGDVFRAIDPGELFAMHRQKPDQGCPIGCRIVEALGGTLTEAARAIEAALDRVTVADLAGAAARPPTAAGGVSVTNVEIAADR